MKPLNQLKRLTLFATLFLSLSQISYAAVCEYEVTDTSRNRFQAEVQITNYDDTVVNGWEITLQYTGENRLIRSGTNNVSGRNPYIISNSSGRPLIESGETIVIPIIGTKSRSDEAEIPELVGAVCDDVIEPNLIDIKDAIFTSRQADCAAYSNDHNAAVRDIQLDTDHDLALLISATAESCSFVSNSIPNYDFNDDTANFGGPATEQDLNYMVSRVPEIADEPTPISQEVKNGIMLNGVLLDIISAGCYQPSSPIADVDGNVNIGCGSDEPWLLDPLSTEQKFGADVHNAHVQPGGQYHYHGSPKAMYDDDPSRRGSPVIGFAADGFPIYGPYFFDRKTGKVREARSGYSLKEGERVAINELNPGGEYTGIYNDDWEFSNAGDLDECNGMEVNGQYGYYAIEEYPWVIKCLSGTPHDSFVREAPNAPPPL